MNRILQIFVWKGTSWSRVLKKQVKKSDNFCDKVQTSGFIQDNKFIMEKGHILAENHNIIY